MTGRNGYRYVRVLIEHEVEVVDEVALRAAVLRGDAESYVELPQHGAPEQVLERMRDQAVARLVTEAMGPIDYDAARASLERAGIRLISGGSNPALRDPENPDQYLGVPPTPARRDDGTFAFEDQAD